MAKYSAELDDFRPLNNRNFVCIADSYLGSGLIDYSQKMTMAAMQIADMNV
jgi:hypothetical protein